MPERASGDWVAEYSSLSDRVRHELIARQLDDHLPASPGPVVDLGAGSGVQGIMLARRGFDVALVDVSETRLDAARHLLLAEPDEVAGRVHLVAADVDDAVGVLGAGAFGVVCCHALLPSVDDPPGVLGVLAALARRGATVSVVFKNARALAMRAGLAGRFADALDLVGGGQERDRDGSVLAAHTLDEITSSASGAGIRIDAWYGVQTFTAHLRGPPDDARFADALALEERAGRLDPYRLVARQVHVVGHLV